MRILDTTLTSDESGFSLIEVLVAIFIGLIVMGMAVAILASTNSTSLRVLAKSEAQQTTRASMVRMLDKLSNAESLEKCRVGVDKATQDVINAYPNRSLVGAGLCKERSSSGNVLIWAQPNRLCFFNKGKSDTDAPEVQCISRGGKDATQPNVYNNTILNMNMTNCISHLPGSDKNLIYLFTCKASGSADAVKWPTSFAKPSASVLLADLSPNSSSITAAPTPSLFTYSFDDGPPTTAVVSSKLKKVIAVRIDMDIDFDKKTGSNSGETYRFSQTVVLRGSLLAQEENYNG